MKRKALFSPIHVLILLLTSLAWLVSQETVVSSSESLSDIIVIGHDAATFENPRILRVDKDGNLLWDKPIPLQKWGNHHQYFGDRNLTEDAFYLASYRDENKIDGKNRILKLDKNGDLVWDITLSPERHYISANPVYGGVYIATFSEGLYRIDSNGIVLWGPKDYGYTDYNVSTDVTTGGAYLIAKTDNKVLKVDKDGDLVWDKIISKPETVETNPIDGGVYIGNKSDSFRLDGEGNTIWQRSSFPSPYTYGRAVNPFDGSLYIGSGWANLVARVTMDNTVVFNISTPTYNENLAASIEDDSVYVGQYAQFGVFKYAGNGNLIWNKTFGPPSWIGYYGIVGVYTGMPSYLNTPPTVEAGGPYTVDEGGSVPLDGSGSTDNEQDPATLTYEWDLDGDGFHDDATGINPAFSAAGLDGPGSVTVGLKVTDDDGESDTDTTMIEIRNVAPTILTLMVPWEEPVNINEQASFSIDVTFTDPAGAMDEAYNCEFDLYHDGETFATGVKVAAGYGSCSTPLAYDLPGVYAVKVTITDKDGGSASATAANFIVIFDPEGGFVTGGGWIWSSEGACPRCPASPEGKANFGLVSKYKNGASVPTGNTNFQFKSGDLHFKSSSYEWLVIAGANAKYKGEGSINGEGEYKFMLTATDGDLLGNDKVDEFRIRIWDDNGLYYDNKAGLDNEEYGGTELGGGNIKIHKAK
jgi:hypothetical protein